MAQGEGDTGSSSGDKRKDEDALTRATKLSSLVTGLLAVVLGAHTIVSERASRREQRDAALRDRIAAEEAYWASAGKELTEIAQLKATDPGPAWRLRHQLLASRILRCGDPFEPSLNQFSEEQRKVLANIRDLRGRVENSLTDATLFADEAARALDRTFVCDDNVRQIAAAKNLSPAQTQTAQTGAAQIATRANVINLTPANSDGWDIDVFWCDRSDRSAANANFREAVTRGKALARLAQQGTAVGGEKLGRVRVKVLPLNRQSRTDVVYPSSGLTLRYDDPAEAKFAAALTGLDGFSGYRPDPNRNFTSK